MKVGRALSLLIVLAFATTVYSQADGNPHEWDRLRRCDQQDYEVPCGPCEGIGGIPYGDLNEEIDLSSCEIVGYPEDLPEPTPIAWGTQWTLPIAYEVLIGKKTDAFCFQTFPGNDSVGELCYRKQTGSKVYDMLEARAFRQDLEVETPVGNITSTVIHQGQNFWIVNHLPWYAGGIHQCICTMIREGFASEKIYYPVQYNWVEKMVYIGKERLFIEYINTVEEVDHWAFGPHHLWTYPDTGNIVRMWQPFNGLQVYPAGVAQGNVDSTLYDDIPPALCQAGGAILRIGCDDAGYPMPDEKLKEKEEERKRQVGAGEDMTRAREKVPRGHYKGLDFGEMSSVLNSWLNASAITSPCSYWSVEELHQLQAILYLARESDFDKVYRETTDNRRIREQTIKDLEKNWKQLNKIAKDHPDTRLKNVRRDGHCHEAVMWYVHHITEDMKQILRDANVRIPLLSPSYHGLCYEQMDQDGQRVCDAYREQVTCASCHSNVLP